jgi:hypothetical protein
MPRDPKEAAKAEVMDYVYRWFVYGKGKLFRDDNDPTNKGLREGTEGGLRKLYEFRRGKKINSEGDGT